MGSWIGNKVGLSLAVLLFAEVAGAQPSPLDRKLAQSLFDEARKAMDDGRLPEACEKFGKSQKLDPAGGTILNLALCHAKQGKVATAWAEFNEAYSAAIKDGRQDRATFAKENIEALKTRLPKLAIALDPRAPAGIEVRLDGEILPPAALGVEAPVDPGEHVVEAKAADRMTFTARPSLGEAETKKIVIPDLAPIVPIAPPPPTVPIQPPPPPFVAPEVCQPGFVMRGGRCLETPDHMHWGESKLSTASWVLGSVGAASLITFGVTGVLALSAKGEASNTCAIDRGYCADQAGIDAETRARSFAWVSSVTLVVGVAATVTALILPRTKVKPETRAAHLAATGRFEF